jgi:precorrin-8X/cobalt-precorrin-8 methylmutase
MRRPGCELMWHAETPAALGTFLGECGPQGLPQELTVSPEGDCMVTWPSEEPADDQAMEEEESYRILRSRIDLSRLPKFSRDVTERVIHASADFDYATDLVCDEESLAAAVTELAAGAPVIADAAMVAAGISACPVICKINEPLTQRLARTAGIGRAAAAVRLAFGEAGPGSVWVIGGGATALQELLSRGVEPAFVIGLPVGFVGAAEAKDALRASGLQSLTNVSEKGGAVVAAAAFDALLRSAVALRASQAAHGGDAAMAGDGTGWQ